MIVEDYLDHREVARDLIDLLRERADMLADSASHGVFDRHAAFCTQADVLLAKFIRAVPAAVADLYRSEAATVIERHTRR